MSFILETATPDQHGLLSLEHQPSQDEQDDQKDQPHDSDQPKPKFAIGDEVIIIFMYLVLHAYCSFLTTFFYRMVIHLFILLFAKEMRPSQCRYFTTLQVASTSETR